MERTKQALGEEKARVIGLVNQFFESMLDRVSEGEDSHTAMASLEEKLEKIKRGSIKALIQYCSEEGTLACNPTTFEICPNDSSLLSVLRNSVSISGNRHHIPSQFQ